MDAAPSIGEPAGWRHRLRGLKFQIVLWTVLPLTLVLIGVGFTGVYSHEQAMHVLVSERDDALAAGMALQVAALLQERITVLDALARQPALQTGGPVDRQAALEGAGDLDGTFAANLVLIDDTGVPLPTSRTNSETPADPAALAELAADVMARQSAAALAVPGDAPDTPILLFGVPAGRQAGGAPTVLVGALSISSLGLDTLLDRLHLGSDSGVYLVDGAGRVLGSAPSGLTGGAICSVPCPELAAMVAGTSARTMVYQVPGGEKWSLAYAPVPARLPGVEWNIVIQQHWHDIVGPVLRYSQFMPLVAVLAALVSLLTLYYGIRSIVQPLRALSGRAEQVAWGNFAAAAAPVGGVQEIEDLRRTLDQMARRIQSYQTGMHDYIAAITQGQEEERRRLARELHDETVQALIALGQRVEMAQKALPSDVERAADRLSTVRALVAETLEGVRRFSRDLRPIYLEDLGFIPAIEMLIRNLPAPAGGNGTRPLAVELAVTGQVRRLPPDLELAAYRILQEAINNVVQHARASRAWIEVQFGPAHLLLAVRDDGQGFDVPRPPEHLTRLGHFGLMGIGERALLYGGQVSIESAPGRGTTIRVRLPYPKEN